MARPIVYGPSGSTFVRSARLALEEKGVPHELVPLGPGENRQPPHLERQPFGRVPAFEHDGFALYETQAIMRYVDETFPGPKLQPADVKQRARMNQILGIVDWYAWPSLAAGIVFNRLVAPYLGVPVNEQAITNGIAPGELSLKQIERLMGDNSYLTGIAITLADLAVAPIVAYLPMVPEGKAMLPKFPRLEGWLGRMQARDSMKNTVPQFR